MWVVSAAPIFEIRDWADLPPVERQELEADWNAYLEEVHQSRACQRCWKVLPLQPRWFSSGTYGFNARCRSCRPYTLKAA